MIGHDWVECEEDEVRKIADAVNTWLLDGCAVNDDRSHYDTEGEYLAAGMDGVLPSQRRVVERRLKK